MRVIQEQRQEFFDFANRVLGTELLSHDTGGRVIASVAEDERILAVAVFTRWTRAGCEMSIASDGSRNWMSRGLLRTCAAYVFEQCGKQRVTGMISEDNETSMRLAMKAGFVHEGRLRRWFIGPDGKHHDGIVMGMLKEECKWLDSTH